MSQGQISCGDPGKDKVRGNIKATDVGEIRGGEYLLRKATGIL